MNFMSLLRALGSAVVVGAGVKMGGDLYSALRKRITGEPAEDDRSPIDDILDGEDAEEKLVAEKKRIDRELARLRKKKSAAK